MRSLEGNLWRYKWFSALVFTPFALPTLVLFWKDCGLTMFDIFLLQGIFAIAVVLLEVPTGMVADRLGKRRSLLISTSLWFVSFVLYFFSHSFAAFLALEILMALASSLLSGADSSLLYDSLKALGREDEFSRIEGQTRGIQMTSFALSNLLGGFIGSYSMRAAIGLSALGPLLALFLVLGMKEVQSYEAEESFGEALRSYRSLLKSALRFVWKHRLVRWQLMLVAVLTGSSTWLLWLYQPYMKHTGLPVWAFGLVFASFNLFAAFVSQQAWRIESAMGQQGTLVLLMVLQTAPLFLMAGVMVPFSFLFILGHQAARGLLRPILHARILKYTFADKRSTVLSLGALGGRFFFAFTALLIGWFSKQLPFQWNLSLQGMILLVLFAGLFWMYRSIPEKYFVVKESVQKQQ